MKIVVLDGYTENPGDLSWAPLEALGELTVYPRTRDGREAAQRIGDAQVVLTSAVPITREILDACPGVGLIGVMATGYDQVDCAAARQRGIPVSNVPAYGTAAVAQFAIALLLEVCLHVGHHDATVRQGRWAACPDWCYWDEPLVELEGKTMGVVGFGRIGRRTAGIARALGMEVLACDTARDDAGRALARYVSLEELLALSDVVALHCPLTPQTAGLINRETLAAMKDGAILINNSRGGLVVEEDLARALNTGKLRGAGLDVAASEPIRPESPLLSARNCILTPHISWAARECRQRILTCTAENIRAYQAGAPIHVVNP